VVLVVSETVSFSDKENLHIYVYMRDSFLFTRQLLRSHNLSLLFNWMIRDKQGKEITAG